MRRSMMRIANVIAKKQGCEALVTGESLAQVASQTVKALQCTDAAQDLPILRPLIGMDKTEIIETSRHINTFETSILPYEDCCTIFTPPHPKIRPELDEILEAEAGDAGPGRSWKPRLPRTPSASGSGSPTTWILWGETMTAEIISVGTELLLGNILNTNAQYLSRELADLGITVQRESTIGDNHGRLADFVNEAKSRCDLLVFTGGLGPTADDLTKETVAACFGDELAFDEAEWEKITRFFARSGRETTPNNRKQAMVPTKGHKIINNHGTAPGAWFEQEGHCAVLMPGVPHEMKAMWTESVRPLLLARQNCTLHSVTLRVLGGESNIEYRVKHLLENANPTAAIYCKTGECEIRITARASSEEDGEKMCRAYATKFYDLLGDAVYDEDVAGLEETVVRTLKEQGLTLSTAESCTGGMIAQRVTSVSGSSEVFGYGFVTYWEQAKTRLVGVEPEVIAKYNVVSAPVAARMALGAAAASGSDIAVSVTGVAGPTGGDEVRPVGTVYLGAARGDTVYVQKLFVSRPDRALVRARAAQAALALALRLAQGKVPAHTKPLAASEQHSAAALDALNEAFLAE